MGWLSAGVRALVYEEMVMFFRNKLISVVSDAAMPTANGLLSYVAIVLVAIIGAGLVAHYGATHFMHL